MANIIIDRRRNDKGKSTVNRRRFVGRVRSQVKEAVKKVIRDGDIKDIVHGGQKKIHIPGKGLTQPTFHHSSTGGKSERTYPGNKEYNQGDRINRPEGEGAGGTGNGASDSGEGEDGFGFHLTRDEFLELFFEDLELPDLVKRQITTIEEYTNQRAGFSVDGNPARLNILRSMRQAKGRRFALRNPKKRELKELETQLDQLNSTIAKKQAKKEDSSIEEQERDWVMNKITVLKRKIKAIPFIDDNDLRYNRWEKIPKPTTQAVMFCLMDVSGSMGEWEKEMAKRFFMLLYLFLTRQYKKVDIVFIRHTTVATEVDEHTFFYSRESGGTLVSTALELMNDIIKERYSPDQWNIFGCQCSDGDNWHDDSTKAQQILTNSILPASQYYAYLEIDRRGGKDSDLWPYYQTVANTVKHFAMNVVSDINDIYPVFRQLFEKRE